MKTYEISIEWPEKNPHWTGWEREPLEDYIKRAIEGWHVEIGQDMFNFKDPLVVSVTDKS